MQQPGLSRAVITFFLSAKMQLRRGHRFQGLPYVGDFKKNLWQCNNIQSVDFVTKIRFGYGKWSNLTANIM